MNLFGPFQFSALTSPWALALLPVVGLLLIAEWYARPFSLLRVSTGDVLARVRGHKETLRRRSPALLRAIGLSLLIIALARPLQGIQVQKDRANVIDIMLLVDVSGSMQAMDFVAGGEPRNRLYVTKQAVRDFIRSRKEAPEDRFGLDRIGLVLYGAYAWTQCPLTLDYGVLEHELDLAQIEQDEIKSQKTAIGSAIGLAVSRLRKSEAKTKLIILLTDGQNNAGELDPMTAAQLAKDYNIRIYTIGAGSPEGGYMPSQNIFGQMIGQPAAPVDEEALNRIAEITGGKYYRATDTKTLENAYAEINQLETTEVDIGEYYEHKEGFVPFVITGAIALLLSIFSRRLWFEPIP